MTSKIKNFDDFLFESHDPDTKVVDTLSAIARYYESSRAFYTDQSQFHVEEERRDWRDTRKYAELEELITHDAFYKLKFTMDGKNYLAEITFSFSFNGTKAKDAPDELSDGELNRLNVVLERIDLKRIVLKSTDMDYKSSNISEPIRKACEAFLVKVLEADYDSLGTEIYRIEQN